MRVHALVPMSVVVVRALAASLVDVLGIIARWRPSRTTLTIYGVGTSLSLTLWRSFAPSLSGGILSVFFHFLLYLFRLLLPLILLRFFQFPGFIYC